MISSSSRKTRTATGYYRSMGGWRIGLGVGVGPLFVGAGSEDLPVPHDTSNELNMPPRTTHKSTKDQAQSSLPMASPSGLLTSRWAPRKSSSLHGVFRHRKRERSNLRRPGHVWRWDEPRFHTPRNHGNFSSGYGASSLSLALPTSVICDRSGCRRPLCRANAHTRRCAPRHILTPTFLSKKTE